MTQPPRPGQRGFGKKAARYDAVRQYLNDTTDASSDAVNSRTSDESPEDSLDEWTARSRGSSQTSNSILGPHMPTAVEQAAQWQQHIRLSDFTAQLTCSLRGVFPNRKNQPRYRNVWVLLMHWQQGDPNLPVLRELEALRETFRDVFHFDVKTFEIPAQQSHLKVSQSISNFVAHSDDSEGDLKIFYYAGHARLGESGDLIFSSYRGDHVGSKGSSVAWSGIQQTLEHARSDILILLDCCAAGRGHLGDGNGVTELLGACSYETRANGVGSFSFSHQLNMKLGQLARSRRAFTVGELYDQVHEQMQSYRRQGVHPNERYPAPVHHFLTRDKTFPSRSIELSVINALPRSLGSSKRPAVSFQQVHAPAEQSRPRKRVRWSTDEGVEPPPAPGFVTGNQLPGAVIPRLAPDQHLQDQRTMLFAVRLHETMPTKDLAVEAFKEWFKNIPANVQDVVCKVEAQFLSDSTLLLVRVPMSVWSCMEGHPALMALGPVRSSNVLCQPLDLTSLPRVIKTMHTPEKLAALGALENLAETPRPSDPVNPVMDEVMETDGDPRRPPTTEEPSHPDTAEGHQPQLCVTGPAVAYIYNIRDKYPNASPALVERLGQANWERHVRIRSLMVGQAEVEGEASTTVREPSVFKPASSLKDSGLGTSVQSPPVFDYDPSIATSLASKPDDADSGHFRVPSMPGRSFFLPCPYCGDMLVRNFSRSDWKRHVFKDLRPYICTFSGCEESLSTFASRTEWVRHEMREHLLKDFWPCRHCNSVLNSRDSLHAHRPHCPSQGSSDTGPANDHDEERLELAVKATPCRLCHQSLKSVKAYASHVGKHMESVALAVLPRDVGDSEDDVSAADSNGSIHSGTPPPRAISELEGEPLPPYNKPSPTMVQIPSLLTSQYDSPPFFLGNDVVQEGNGDTDASHLQGQLQPRKPRQTLDGDDGRDARADTRAAPGSTRIGRELACIFSKLNPAKWSACRDRAAILTVGQLRLHLMRHHQISDNACPRCRTKFPSERALVGHNVIKGDCDSLEYRGVNKRTLLQSMAVLDDPVRQWYLLWDRAFPGCPRPSSPYIDSSESPKEKVRYRDLGLMKHISVDPEEEAYWNASDDEEM